VKTLKHIFKICEHLSANQDKKYPSRSTAIYCIISTRWFDFHVCLSETIRNHRCRGRSRGEFEAALAAARMGCQTLLLTMNADSIGQMSCNPASVDSPRGISRARLTPWVARWEGYGYDRIAVQDAEHQKRVRRSGLRVRSATRKPTSFA